MTLSMYGAINEIEQAHAEAGQFTEMLSRTPNRGGKLAASQSAGTSDPPQSHDPPAQDLFRRLWEMECKAIALGLALLVVVLMEVQ